MDLFATFLNDPLVQPLWAVMVVAFATFLLTVYRALGAGNFDLSTLPKILNTLVVQKVLPLAILGVAAVSVSDPTTKDALTVAYLGGAVAAAAGEVKQLLDAVAGRASQAGAATS